jgi:plastocyanin
MKKITFGSMLVIVALLLSSCQFHTGLGSLLGGNKSSSSSSTSPSKHVKATHTPPSPKTANLVTITSAGYQPATLQVKVGDTVTWSNNDSATHTVTSDTAGLFDSGPIAQGATFKFTFSQAGTFLYHSTSDTGWAGMVTVTQ